MAPKIDFDTKHLGKEDPLPPFSGKPRVYNMRHCPFAHRTILAMNAKQVDYEVINLDLMNKPDWLVTKSKFGKVPAVEIEEDVCIYESIITAEYIDDYYPQRPLQSKDPAKKAFDKIILEAFAPVSTLFLTLVRMPGAVKDEMTVAYYKALNYLQDELKSRDTKFIFGDEPGLVDYMMWPWFERIQDLDSMDGKMTIGADKYKLLLEYFDRMYKDPAVSQYLVPKDVRREFFATYFKGGFDYNMILK